MYPAVPILRLQEPRIFVPSAGSSSLAGRESMESVVSASCSLYSNRCGR